MKTVRVLAMCSASLVATLAVLALFAWLPSLSQGPVTVQAAALANGGFEGIYQTWGAVDRTIAPGWSLWYGDATTWPDEKNTIAPPKAGEELNTKLGGAKAQRVSWTDWKNFDACLYQQIGGITVGNYVRFSAWAKVVTAMGPWDMQTRVGIDPHGGTNPIDIQYETHSGYWDPYDSTSQEWQRLSVVLMATSPTVTVYACAHPKYAMSFQAYWDDAELSVVPEQRVHLPIVEREHCVVAPGTCYNPDLEENYCTIHGYQRGPYTTALMAPYWNLFWNDDWHSEQPALNRRPECNRANLALRVHSGQASQQCGMTWGTFEAGIYQVITGTTVSDTYRFAIWGMGWTQEQPTPTNPEDWYRSDYTQTGGLSFRVGIDPRGGESYTSTNIIWSDFYDPYDAWHRFEITATAAATRISVWAYANPQGWWLWHNETFWDNANLEVVSMP